MNIPGVGKLLDAAVGLISARFEREYDCIRDARKNAEDFKKKVEDLEDERKRVERAIEAAKRNLGETDEAVERWLQRVNKMMKHAEEINDLEKIAKDNRFNLYCCQQLGKKVEEHAPEVAELLKQADQLFDRSVSYPRAPESIASVPADYYDLQSRSNLVGEIMNALTNPDVKMVGLHGLPGVGKTMLVNIAGKKALDQHLFDEVVIATVSHNPNIRDIQEQIAQQLGLRFESLDKEPGRAKLLSRRLSGNKKILVILDDIWDKINLDDIGISFNDDKDTALGEKEAQSMNAFICRSKILLTSKTSDAFRQMNVESIKCELLSRKEALELFASIVGSAVVNDPDYNSIANQLVEKCGGSPVAVSTIANALKNTSPGIWENALTALERRNPESIDKMDSVYSIIELSYRLLKSEAQSLLELCALEAKASSIDLSYLVRHGFGMQLFEGVQTLEDARDRVTTLVHTLKSSSLLLSTNNDATVKVHDFIRDVILSIVSKEKQMIVIENNKHMRILKRKGELDNCTTISLPSRDVRLPSVLECPKLKRLLWFSKDSPQFEDPGKFFEQTIDLQVLHLRGMHFPSIPSFSSLTNLGTLCLDHCELDKIEKIENMKKLEILSFHGSKIEKLPHEIGKLTDLLLFDISNCSKLEVIPPNTLSKLSSSLEELYMGNSFYQWDVEGNASLTELKNLKYLTTLHVHVRDTRILQADVFPETLRRFRIFLGDMPWDWLNQHKYSRTLKLKVNARIELNNGIRTLLREVEELYVDELKGFRSLLFELDNTGFPNLKTLHVQNNSEILYIINSGISREAFPLVESIFLHNLSKLKKILHGQIDPGCLRRLRTTEVTDCGSLENLLIVLGNPFSPATSRN